MSNEQQFAGDDFEIDIDLTNVKEFDGGGSFAPEVPPGEYVFDAVGLDKHTASSGNATLKLTAEVVEGDYAGKKLTQHYTLTEKALGRFKNLQLACGARLDKIRKSEIIGARFRATVVHNPGKPQMGPDGTPKCDANGVPYPPTIFANIERERPMEEAVAAAAPPAPPPVTRKAANNAGAVRRA